MAFLTAFRVGRKPVAPTQGEVYERALARQKVMELDMLARDLETLAPVEAERYMNVVAGGE